MRNQEIIKKVIKFIKNTHLKYCQETNNCLFFDNWLGFNEALEYLLYTKEITIFEFTEFYLIDENE